MPAADLLLLSRVGCHLCEDARSVIDRVAGAAGVVWREVDVDTDPELRAEWGDMVPVVLLGEVCLDYYRIDPERLATALRR